MITPYARSIRPAVDQFRRWLRGPVVEPPPRLFRAIAWLWRRMRQAYVRIAIRQPRFLLVVDRPPRLEGFGAITGWAVSRLAPVIRVEAWINDRLVASTPPTSDRPDVQRAFPHFRFSGRIGFRLAPEPDHVADGRYRLTLRAYDARGLRTELDLDLEVNGYRLADRLPLPTHLQGSNREYQYWRQATQAAARPATVVEGPAISIIMPLYRPSPDHLRAAIDSIRRQTYPRWQLCLCDDGSRQNELTAYLRELSASDSRIQWISHESNRGIAAATNSALSLARSPYVALMDQDDELEADALAQIAAVIVERRPDVLYTDEDRIDASGCFVDPFFKPDWSPDLLHSMMYLAHLCVYRRRLLDKVGWCRSAYDGAQDWDLALRATRAAKRIEHLPRVLYHWRHGGHSAQVDFNRKCRDSGRRAIAQALAADGKTVRVDDGPTPCTFHVRYPLVEPPLASILVPTRDNWRLLRRCLTSIRRRTSYANYEIIVVDNGSREPRTRRYLDRCGARVIRLPGPFNHSHLCNEGVRAAHGRVVVLLNDDTEVITDNWLTVLVEQAMRPEVGAAGLWLLHPDGRTQHAGIVVGVGAVASPVHSGLLADGVDRGVVRLTRNVTAVTGACLAIRRDLYLEVGGLDADHLPTSFNDVDLCLRLHRAGFRNLCTGMAAMYHRESSSRRIGDESGWVRVMEQRWGDELGYDRYWNGNLPHGSSPPAGFAFHWPGRTLEQSAALTAAVRQG